MSIGEFWRRRVPVGDGESSGGGAFGMLGGGAFGNDSGGAFGPVDSVGIGTRIGCGNDGGVQLVLGVGAAAARNMGERWERLLLLPLDGP